jgi:hypothetical protein
MVRILSNSDITPMAICEQKLPVTQYFLTIFHGIIKVKVKFTLEQATKAHSGSRGIVLLFFKLGTSWGSVVYSASRPLYPLERPGTHCIEGWVDPRAGMDRCGKSRPHRDSIPGPSSP